MKIGIIGRGFVGDTYFRFFNTKAKIGRKKSPIYVIDPKTNPENNYKGLLKFRPEIVYICVPTPMLPNGDVDISIVEDVINRLEPIYKGVIVLKSTITPDKIFDLLDRSKDEDLKYRFVYYPEFLRENNAWEDLLCRPLQVLGGYPNAVNFVIDHLEKTIKYFKHTERGKFIHFRYQRTTVYEAAMIKYFSNAYLATKITFFNELFKLADKNSMDFEVIRKALESDERIGEGQTQVPGPDGKFGFGGACLPKDILAISNFSGGSLYLLYKDIEINNEIRSKYDLYEIEKINKIKF